MRGCLHPDCHVSSGRGRILCMAHWMQLPVEVKAKVREQLRRHDSDSVRVFLHDFYSMQSEMKARPNGNNDPF